MADFNTVFENARPYDDRPNMINRKNARVQKQIKRKTCAQTKTNVSQKRGTERFTIPSDDNAIVMNGKTAFSIFEKDTPKERLVIDGEKKYPAGIILNNYSEFKYDAEFQGSEIRNKGKLLNTKGIGVGGHLSTTDLDRRSIQISTDKSYGGVYDDHTGMLMYSKMPGGWGNAETGIRHSINWGKFAEDDSMTISRNKTKVRNDLEVGGNLTVTGTMKTTQTFGNPIGTIIQWSGDIPPTGYLMCDGSAVSRTTHAKLFGVIGTTFGGGDGTTTFNLPDYRGYVLVGKNPTDADINTIDNVHRGEKTHSLTLNEMPSHTHTSDEHTHVTSIVDPGHSHMISMVNSNGAPDGWKDGNPSDPTLYWRNVRSGMWGVTNPLREVDQNKTNIKFSIQPAKIAINKSGGDTHFSLMQPYKVVMYCIKYDNVKINNEVVNKTPYFELTGNELTVKGEDEKVYAKFTGETTYIPGKLDFLPRGIIVAWNGDVAPEGWALCNGENGTPDLRNRFILGNGAKKIKEIGGEEAHTLTTDEMPSHSHSITDAGHKHTGGWAGVNGNSAFGCQVGAHLNPTNPGVSGNINIQNGQNSNYHAFTDVKYTGIKINNAGSGKAHDNMPPYYVLAFIMRL